MTTQSEVKPPMDKNDKLALLPCPFCGVVPTMQSHTQEDEMDEGRYLFLVECGNGKCPMGLVSTGGPSKEAAKAAEQWNSRASVAAPPPDWLRDAGAVLCVNDPDAGARVEIRFADLADAQALHKMLVQARTNPSPVAAPVDAETQVNAMWEALKAKCCKNPAEAKLAVFVSEQKFKTALAPFAAILSKRLGSAAVGEQELERLKKWQDDVVEREAAVCPEDVPFDEYIRHLERKLKESTANA